MEGKAEAKSDNGSLPAVPESSNTIIQRIHAAKLELEKASNDSERKEILDMAKRAETIAAAAELTEIQVVAANLKIDCEVAITRANPPMSKAESGILGAESTNNRHGIPNPMPKVETSIPQTTIRDFRKAYDNLDDDEIEQAKQEAIDNQVPLTRSHFKEKSAEKKELEKGNTMHTFGKQRNNTEEWYTPTDIIDRVHAVLGEIDLDPL